MRHYATLFDSRFAPQGLALYESLLKHSSEPFTLHVLPLDDECANILESLKLPGLVVLGYRAFVQDQDLAAIRDSRTHQEWAWTCASQLCEWLLLCPDCELTELTYLDADVYFFSDPAPVFKEIGDRSIAITPHRFVSSRRWMEATSGIYNVGWITFRNTNPGIECLQMWAMQVRAQCSAVSGCGDQKYLDQFVPIFGREVCVIQNIGVNLAPWNLANYRVEPAVGDGVMVGNPNNEYWHWAKAVFVHYHEYVHDVRLTNYLLRPEDIKYVYAPYIAAVKAAQERIGAPQPA